MRETDPVEAAREAALKFLERTRRTRRELEKRLAERGHEPRPVAAALDRLARVGLVDDLAYAKAFVRSKLARRATSLRLLRGQLRARGVAERVVEEALAALDAEAAADPDDEASPLRRAGAAGERARAERVLVPLLRRYRNLDPRETRVRCAAALSRRGFDYDTVTEVLAAALRTPD